MRLSTLAAIVHPGWVFDHDDEVLFVRWFDGDNEIRFDADVDGDQEVSAWRLLIHQDVRDSENYRVRYVCAIDAPVEDVAAVGAITMPPALTVAQWAEQLSRLDTMPNDSSMCDAPNR